MSALATAAAGRMQTIDWIVVVLLVALPLAIGLGAMMLSDLRSRRARPHRPAAPSARWRW